MHVSVAVKVKLRSPICRAHLKYPKTASSSFNPLLSYGCQQKYLCICPYLALRQFYVRLTPPMSTALVPSFRLTSTISLTRRLSLFVMPLVTALLGSCSKLWRVCQALGQQRVRNSVLNLSVANQHKLKRALLAFPWPSLPL